MIKFEKLKVKGFKSFVEPTEIFIENGLTGIVGPNGCGKSNLVEDFRFDWAEENSWLDLWGMESPALTASLAIGEYVCKSINSKNILN